MLLSSSVGGGDGKELTDEELDGEGLTDATGEFCGFRISRCGLRVEVCASFFSTGPVSGWAETVGIG